VRALVKATASPGLELREVPKPAPGPGEVLVRVLRTGICGTDLHIRSWDAWAQQVIRPPLTIGHEIAGHIDAVPASNIWRHPAGLDPDVAAIFDPFGNAVHAALSFPVLGEDVLVTGAGPIGIMAASVVRHAGARNVVITDVSEPRLALARSMGAVTRAVDVTRTTVDAVMAELGMKEGFDVGLEMSGAPAALHSMISSMAHGGRIALLGLPSGEIAFDWVKVITSMLTVKGIYGREIFETWYAMSVLVGSGLDITPVITHRFPAADFEQAFDVAASGQAGKVVMDWSQR
jgi:threonine 3-dehydrogenase